MFITLENKKIKVTLSTFAGGIESIFNRETGNEHFWQYDSAVWSRRTPICFPICGGLTDSEYTYQGKTYTLPMHGFLREKELTIIEQTGTKAVMQFVSDAETKSVYPFDFKFTLIQELSDDSFVVRYNVENTSSGDMYYSVGCHYTYNMPIVPGESQKDYRYAFGASQNAGKLVMDGGTITGKTKDIFHGGSSFDLDGFFENGSTILEMSDIDPKFITLESKNTGAFTKVAFDNFSYSVLWAPKGISPFACIEFWTGMLDQVGHDKDITKKLGITKLAKGMSSTCTQIITIK